MELAALGLGLLFLLRGGTPRKGSTEPSPESDSRERTRAELENAGFQTKSPFLPGILTPGGDAAISAGLKGAAAVSAVAALAGASAGVGGAAGAFAGAGAAVGMALTQDAAGAFVGLQAIQGTFFNFGRVAGREIDKLFGGAGDNKSASSITAQVAFGIVAAAVSVLGTAAAIGLFPLAILTFGISALVSDEVRKSRGQNGAFDDLAGAFNKHFDAVYFAGLAAVADQTRTVFGREPNAQELIDTRAGAARHALGYALKMNALHREQWRKKPWGIGVSEARHLEYGAQRDYWVTDEQRVWEHAYLAAGNGDEAAGRAGFAALKKRSEEDYMLIFSHGAFQANLEAYLEWMNQGWGVGQSGKSHAEWGRDRVGAFEAREISSEGNAFAYGVWVYWEATQRSERLVISGKVGPY